MNSVIESAKLFCKKNHCVFRVKYEPCLDRFQCVFRKVYNSDGVDIIVENEVQISDAVDSDYCNAINNALAKAGTAIRRLSWDVAA